MFLTNYGVGMVDGPLAGLCARAVVVIDGSGQVAYTELVPEIAQEPDYDAALALWRGEPLSDFATEQWAKGETCRDLMEDRDWLKSTVPEVSAVERAAPFAARDPFKASTVMQNSSFASAGFTRPRPMPKRPGRPGTRRSRRRRCG